MFISHLELICLFLEIFQQIDNVYTYHKKYSIDSIDRIIGGQPANKSTEIQITDQIDILYLFEFEITYYF